MPEDIKTWLEGLGLSQYADAFEENDIGWSVLPKLDHALLKEMGVKSIGHRVQLLEAASNLDDEQALAETEAGKLAAGGEAERRQLTVMFCDLAGSTELSRQLDPEEMRRVNRAFERCCETAIKQYDGFLARYMGRRCSCLLWISPSARGRCGAGDTWQPRKSSSRCLRFVQTFWTHWPLLRGSELVSRRVQLSLSLSVRVRLRRAPSAEMPPNLANRLQSIAEDNTAVIALVPTSLREIVSSVRTSGRIHSRASTSGSRRGE